VDRALERARQEVRADRLSPLDVSVPVEGAPTTAMHVGGVAVLKQPEGGLDYEGLVALIGRRIALVPRYRQKVRTVPGRLANPVWVDDEDFDLTYHVRRSALPKPGSQAQLHELVGRLMSRRLDRHRPLWEIYLVEGLEGDRVGIITKTHHAMVDGVSAVDIGTVLLDQTPEPRAVPDDDWVPQRAPGAVALLAGALGEYAAAPTHVLDAARGAVVDARSTATRAVGAAGGVLSSLRTVSRQAPSSPLNTTIGEQRRLGAATTSLADYRTVRTAHGGTVNDVVLAVVAGALRAWLLTRGEPVSPATTVRAMVPVSVRDGEARQLGNRVSSYFVDLPVGEGNPVMRLHQVSFAMRGHGESGQSVGADALVHLSGFAGPHAARARRAGGVHAEPPAVQPRGHQRARPAVPAVRRRGPAAAGVPGGAADEGPGARRRRHLLRRRRLLRAQRRPRRAARRRRPGRVPGGGPGRAAGDGADVTAVPT
jgi:WS/DGAT/MGAT family acyltransferase